MTTGITPEQYDVLLRPIRPSRVSFIERGGKRFSHLEAWDIKAHLIRVFGFGNFDIETLDVRHAFTRDYRSNDRDMWEVAYQATVQLTIRDPQGNQLCRFSESSVDSQSGGTALGDLHDNAIKAATSGALKRCATSLGTQFGLSLYDNGTQIDVVKTTIVKPDGVETDTQQEGTGADLSDDQRKVLSQSLGAEEISETPAGPVAGAVAVQSAVGNGRPVEDTALPDETPETDKTPDGPQFERKIDTAEQARQAVESMTVQGRNRGVKAAE